jgi:hypothetical protein
MSGEASRSQSREGYLLGMGGIRGALMGMALALSASATLASTNVYHLNRRFEPCPPVAGAPTVYNVITAISGLTEIVQAKTNVIFDTNNTCAVEYESVALGHDGSEAAWAAVLDDYESDWVTHSNKLYDNVGWVKGVGPVGDTWAAHLWLLQNHAAFRTSLTNFWVSPAGKTNLIEKVLVGTIGDYAPMQDVVDVGPTNWGADTPNNFLGRDASTDVSTHADFTAYYRLLVLKVDTIEASSPVATNSPQFFEGGKTNFGDPCSAGLSPGQALIVFFDAVRSIAPATSNEVVNDFDVTLKAHILPSSVTADQLTENWSKVHGPTSGSLDRKDTFEVKYQNPKKGGLYQFEFDLGLPGYPKSGANVLLPLAGAESSAFVQTEFARIRTWVDNQLPGIPIVDRLYAIILLRRAMTVSANLDYAPGDWVGGQSPCRRYSIYANETLTVEGVVMSSPKLANMMWGVMCRRFMYWDWFTNLGADIRNRIDHGVLSGDSTAARNSYELGRDLSEDGIGALHSKMREYRDLIREPNAVEFRLFPSEDTLSAPPQVPNLP